MSFDHRNKGKALAHESSDSLGLGGERTGLGEDNFIMGVKTQKAPNTSRERDIKLRKHEKHSRRGRDFISKDRERDPKTRERESCFQETSTAALSLENHVFPCTGWDFSQEESSEVPFSQPTSITTNIILLFYK
ncbi:hypothetical protein JCGZ_19117 [Jatropha curcas]|uniref:Uncharacterized protein n=1 Tax=Jatropha curcas TaxID=180498 RepID=A0A067KCJ0_JATCU|nr:hypothetical protein JCGZ_19117 [Jatropha curcas]